MKAFVIIVALCLSILLIIFAFTGCAKVINVQQEIVEVQIVDSNRRSAWMQPVRAGKVTTFIHHPARYEIIVEYNGTKHTFNNQAIYDKYKNSIGEYTEAVLETKTYDNGKVRWSLTELK